MAYYAFINNEGIVEEVISGKDEYNLSDLPNEFNSWEEYYQTKRSNLICKRTSYNTIANTHTLGGTPFRGNYAGIGFTWDEANDVFYPPQPYPSWTLSSDWVWKAPVPLPDDWETTPYEWNENILNWEVLN